MTSTLGYGTSCKSNSAHLDRVPVDKYALYNTLVNGHCITHIICTNLIKTIQGRVRRGHRTETTMRPEPVAQ